jgi:GT2 family glycosyltransferase
VSGSIGVVVVSHESAADLPACLGAAVAAEGVTDIVVVDNDSSDLSREVVLEVDDERVRLLALSANTGFAGGCNRGFAALSDTCEWVAFLNPDVTLAADCLRLSAAALDADPALAGVAPRLMRTDGVTVDSVGQVLHPVTLEVCDRGFGHRLSAELKRATPVLAACGALAVFRSEALRGVVEENGPFAEHFFCFWEDFELGWRLVNRGWRIESLPEAIATHVRGSGAKDGRGPLRWRRPVDLEACVVTNRWMTLVRHLSGLDLLLRLPLLLMWDSTLVMLGIFRRPRLLPAIVRRWPLIVREWRSRSARSRRRLAELPW